MSSPDEQKCASDVEPSSTRVCWELSYEHGYAAAPDESQSALGMVVLMLLRDNRTDNWDDRDKFAAIVRDHADLKIPEIAGLLGMSPMEVHQVPSVDDPPWTLTHPEEERRIHLRRWTEGANSPE